MKRNVGEVKFIKASSWSAESSMLAAFSPTPSPAADQLCAVNSASISSPSGAKPASFKNDADAALAFADLPPASPLIALAAKGRNGSTDDLAAQVASPPTCVSTSDARLLYRQWRTRVGAHSPSPSELDDASGATGGSGIAGSGIAGSGLQDALSGSPFEKNFPFPRPAVEGPGLPRAPTSLSSSAMAAAAAFEGIGAPSAMPRINERTENVPLFANSNDPDLRAQLLSQQIAQEDAGISPANTTQGNARPQGGSVGNGGKSPVPNAAVFKKARSYQALEDLEKTGYFPAAPKPSAVGVQRGLKDSVVNDMCRAIVKHMVGDVYVASSGNYGGAKKVLNHLYEPVLKSVQSHFRRLPARYALSVNPDDVPMHMRLLAKHHRNPEDINMTVQLKKDDDGNTQDNICEVVVVSDDRDSLLDAITRALTSMKGSILDADVMTTLDGVTLDRFVVKGDFMTDERQEKLQKRIEQNLTRLNLGEDASPQVTSIPPEIPTVERVSEDNLAEKLGVMKMVDKNEVKEEWSLSMSEIKLETAIGSGRSGNTYRAYWRGTQVAAKVVDMTAQNAALSEDLLNEFHREVTVVSMLRHPNIVLFLGAAVEPPKYCLVFEFMHNGTLTDLIRARRAPLDFFRIASEIAQGMNYLHLCSIMHRDLKSGNVLLDMHGTVKISDFGLSCVLVMGQSRDLTAETGTYRWMAPEVIRHEPYSTKADVYSFGVILWEMIAKDQPFRGLTPIQAAFAVARQQMRPALPRQTPLKIGELVEHCWHQDPNRRPDFSAVLEALPLVKRSLKKRDFKNLGFLAP